MMLSLTFVPAAVALFLGGRVREQENRRHARRARRAIEPALRWSLAHRAPVVVRRARCWSRCAGLLATRLGTEFIPSLDEGDIALHALRIPGHQPDAGGPDAAALESAHQAVPGSRAGVQQDRHGGNRQRSDAARVADTFIMMKPREEWPDPRKSKARAGRRDRGRGAPVPGNNYEFTQPIQMRMNELISGVRADVAVKVYGDDLDTLVELAERIEALRATCRARRTSRVEQVTGLADARRSRPIGRRSSRYGLTLDDVQDTVSTAVGGTVAGQIIRGRPALRHRRAACRSNCGRARRGWRTCRFRACRSATRTKSRAAQLGRRRAAVRAAARSRQDRSRAGPNQINRENGKRRVVVTANVRGRDLGGFVAELRERVRARSSCPPGYWIDYGGTFEQLISAASA